MISWFRRGRVVDERRMQDVLSRLEAQLAERQEPGGVPPGGSQADTIVMLASRLDGHSANILELRAEVKTLTIAVAEGIEHEERREKRIIATVRRARNRLDAAGMDDPGLDSEMSQMGLVEEEATDPEQTLRHMQEPEVDMFAAIRRKRGF